LTMCTRSSAKTPTHDTKIYFADTLGELPTLYAASDVAFVGGSLIPIGGHNLIEPASLGLALLSGPHVDNFIAVVDLLTDKEALFIVRNADELAARVIALFQDRQACQRAGARALSVSEQNRGALEKHLAVAGNWIASLRAQ